MIWVSNEEKLISFHGCLVDCETDTENHFICIQFTVGSITHKKPADSNPSEEVWFDPWMGERIGKVSEKIMG